MIKKFWITIIIFTWVFAGDGKKLSRKDISGHSPFKTASLGRYVWAPGEDAIILKKNGALLKIDLLSQDTTVFLDSTDFILDESSENSPWKPGFVPSKIVFNSTGNKILFWTDYKRIWRRSFFARYFIMDLGTGKIRPVSRNNTMLRNVKFSPDGKKVAYVREDNNIYTFELESEKERKLTKSGSESILNGHWGWVYEEEFGSYDGYRWAPDSKSIAFWEENQSEVPIFNLIDEMELYPKLK